MNQAIQSILWIGSSLKDLSRFPDDVEQVIGYGPYLAQTGGNRMTGVTAGSGNVFADLGIEQPGIHQVKASVAARTVETIRERDLTQALAAELLGVDQPKVSALVRGRLSGFTLERLLRFLTDLGCDVEIAVRPTERQGPGRISVAA